MRPGSRAAEGRPQFDCLQTGLYEDGMVLSAIWLKLAAEPASGGIGLSNAQELFVDWAMLTGGGIEEGPEGCESDTKTAGLATLIEVLTADDDDNDLSNGTPNRTAICAIFASRLIESPPGLGLCTESAGSWPCPPDTNRDGVLDAFDFLEFLNWAAADDPRADWNGDGVIGVDDFVRFEAAFRKGC